MITMPFEVDDKKFQQTMTILGKRNQDTRPLLRRCQVTMIRSFLLNFRAEGRPHKWKPLSRLTVYGRRKQSSRILQDTGRLRLSATVEHAPGNVTKFRKDQLIMGSSLKQAGWLQYGTKPYIIRPRTKKALRFKVGPNMWRFATIVRHPGLPPRPFILIQQEDADEMQRLAAEFALEEN
jgi:phage gpG-like protein